MPASPAAGSKKGQEQLAIEQIILKRVGEYWREIAAVLVVLIGAGAVFAYAQHTQEVAEQAAWDAFFMAEYESMTQHDDRLAQRIEAARDEHKDTQAAFYARLRYIMALTEKHELEQAEAAARAFIKAHPKHYFTPQVKLILAKTLMARGRYAEARTTFESIREPGALEPEVQLATAQCLEQEAEEVRDKDSQAYKQKLEQAREAYLKADARREKGWPEQVTELASFSVVLIRDRIDNPEAPTLPPLVVPEPKGKRQPLGPALPPPADSPKTPDKKPDAKAKTKTDKPAAPPPPPPAPAPKK